MMPRTRLCVFVLLVLGACYPNTADIATGEMILSVSDALYDLQDETAILQEQIDSLVAMSARQDSLIRRLAAHAGMPIPQ